MRYLNTDPKFFHKDADALLAGYRAIAKQIDPELPKLFAELPRTPYGVRPMPADFSPDTAEYYTEPALDGSRAGYFNANSKAWDKRPIWGMETLVAHEAVPGHHLQIARAMELGELPEFRRANGYNAYVEGWGLYAETLGFELGLYERSAQPLRPSAGAGISRRAAGRRHRHACPGLEPAAGDRLHGRAHRPGRALRRRRGRSLPVVAGPGARPT